MTSTTPGQHPPSLSASSHEPPRVVIVGGGITGLAAAYALEIGTASPDAPRVEITLLEASTRLGGRIQTDQVSDLILERGPDALFLRQPTTLGFLHDLGLDDQIVRANPAQRGAYVLRQGRLHPLPAGMEGGVPRAIRPLLASRLLSPMGKVRAALELVVPARFPAGDESVDAFVRRRFGAEVAERIAAPLLGNVYNTDTRHLSVLATLPHLREAERTHGSLLRATWLRRPLLPAPNRARPSRGGSTPDGAQPPRGGSGVRSAAGSHSGSGSSGANPASPFIAFRAGLEILPATLQARLTRTHVRLGTPLRAIQPRPNGGFLLHVADGERLTADQLLLTTPAHTAADLLAPLSAAAASHLSAIRYGSVVIVALAFPAEAARTLPQGSGMMVSPGEGHFLAACSWTSQKWPHCAPGGELLLRAHLHAEQRSDLLDLDDNAIVTAVRAELQAFLGIVAEPLVVRVYRWPRAVPTYDVHHLERLAGIRTALAPFPGLHLAGAGYRGSGVPECMRQGTEAAAALLAAVSAPSA